MSEQNPDEGSPSYAEVVGGIFTRSRAASAQNSEDERGRSALDADQGPTHDPAAMSDTPHPLGQAAQTPPAEGDDAKNFSTTTPATLRRTARVVAKSSQKPPRHGGLSEQPLLITDYQTHSAEEECSSGDSSEDSEDESAQRRAVALPPSAGVPSRGSRGCTERAGRNTQQNSHDVDLYQQQNDQDSKHGERRTSSPHPRSRTRTAPSSGHLPAAQCDVAPQATGSRPRASAQQRAPAGEKPISKKAAVPEGLAEAIDNQLLRQALQHLDACDPHYNRATEVPCRRTANAAPAKGRRNPDVIQTEVEDPEYYDDPAPERQQATKGAVMTDAPDYYGIVVDYINCNRGRRDRPNVAVEAVGARSTSAPVLQEIRQTRHDASALPRDHAASGHSTKYDQLRNRAAAALRYLDDSVIHCPLNAPASQSGRTVPDYETLSGKLRICTERVRQILRREENVFDARDARQNQRTGAVMSRNDIYSAAGFTLEREFAAEFEAAGDDAVMAAEDARTFMIAIGGVRPDPSMGVFANRIAIHTAAGQALENELTAENIASGMARPAENARATIADLSKAWVPGDPDRPTRGGSFGSARALKFNQSESHRFSEVQRAAVPASSEPRFTLEDITSTVAEAVKVAVSASYTSGHSENAAQPGRQKSNVSIVPSSAADNDEPPELVYSEGEGDDDVSHYRESRRAVKPASHPKPALKSTKHPVQTQSAETRSEYRAIIKLQNERRLARDRPDLETWARCSKCVLLANGSASCTECFIPSTRRSLSRGRESTRSGSAGRQPSRDRSPSIDDYLSHVTHVARSAVRHASPSPRRTAVRPSGLYSHQQDSGSRDGSRRRNISDVKLPTFNGNNWLAFHQQFESACLANGYNNREKGFRLRCALTGTALNLLTNGGSEAWNYKTMIEALEARYGRTKARATIENQLNDMRKRPDQSAHEFADALDTLASNARMSPQVAASVTYHAFTNGIREYPSMHKYVLSKDHELTLRSAANLAAEWERSIGNDAPHADTWALLEAHRTSQINPYLAAMHMPAPPPALCAAATAVGIPQGSATAPASTVPHLTTVLERMAIKLDAVFDDAERRRQFNDAKREKTKTIRQERKRAPREDRDPDFERGDRRNDRRGERRDDQWERRQLQDPREPPFAFGQRATPQDVWQEREPRREPQPRRDRSRDPDRNRDRPPQDSRVPPRDSNDRGRDA